MLQREWEDMEEGVLQQEQENLQEGLLQQELERLKEGVATRAAGRNGGGSVATRNQ